MNLWIYLDPKGVWNVISKSDIFFLNDEEAVELTNKTDLYESRVELIRKLMPNASIGVDVIVGFPGETDDMFLETYNFIKKLDVTYLHVFSYYERENTKAIELNGVVPKKTRNKRSKLLRLLSASKKTSFYKNNIGTDYNVLFESENKNGLIEGYTENYIRV